MCLYFTSPKYLTFALHFVGQAPLTTYNNFIRAQAMGFFSPPSPSSSFFLPTWHFSVFQLSAYLSRCSQGHFIDESLGRLLAGLWSSLAKPQSFRWPTGDQFIWTEAAMCGRCLGEARIESFESIMTGEEGSLTLICCTLLAGYNSYEIIS